MLTLDTRGSRDVTRAELRSVAPPHRTRRYLPVAHAQLADYVAERMRATLGKGTYRERYCLSAGDQRFFGTLTFRDARLPEGVGLCVGIRNGYDQRVSLGVAFGIEALDTEAMAFDPRHAWTGARHTPNAWAGITEALARRETLSEITTWWTNRVTATRGRALDETQGLGLLCLLPLTRVQFALAKERWHEAQERTLWGLYGCAAVGGKRGAVDLQLDALLRLWAVLCDHYPREMTGERVTP